MIDDDDWQQHMMIGRRERREEIMGVGQLRAVMDDDNGSCEW